MKNPFSFTKRRIHEAEYPQKEEEEEEETTMNWVDRNQIVVLLAINALTLITLFFIGREMLEWVWNCVNQIIGLVR